jgi:hypothetical protein
MQGVVREPAAEGGIERARERQPPAGAFTRSPGFSLDLSDDVPQTRYPLRSVARRHSVHTL